MDIREVAYFLAIVDCGSYTSAAEKLFISQPALSICIRKLEARLNVLLFDRTGNKIKLTEAGLIFEQYARQIKNINQQMQSQIHKLNNLEIGTVRIGITSSKALFLLPRLLSTLKTKLPLLTLEFVEASTLELEKMAFQRELDCVLVNRPFHNINLNYKQLFDEELLLVTPSSWKLSPKKVDSNVSKYPSFDIKQIDKNEFILIKKGFKVRYLSDFLFINSSIMPKIVFETTELCTSFRMTEAGIGASFVFDTYIDYYHSKGAKINLFSLAQYDINKLSFVVAYANVDQLSLSAKKVIDEICQIIPSILKLSDHAPSY